MNMFYRVSILSRTNAFRKNIKFSSIYVAIFHIRTLKYQSYLMFIILKLS